MMFYPGADKWQNGLIGNFLSAILYGGKCIAYEELEVTDLVAVGLGVLIPAGATYCLIVAEAEATEEGEARVIRFRQDGDDPTAILGMPLGDNGIVEIKGDNMADVKFIGITAGLTHTLRIEFFGEA